MADNQYATVHGFVQFPVDERETSGGQKVRDVTIRTPGSEGSLVRITLWPELADFEVEKDDFIAVDGKLDVNQSTGKDGTLRTYINVSASTIATLGKGTRGRRDEVVKKPAERAF